MGPSDDELVPMKNESIDKDIAAFISGHLTNDRRLQRWKQHHDLIEKSLTERAKGVYVFRSCTRRALLTH